MKWITPLEPFIKLNMNGSSIGNPRLASVGGLLHNSSSAWISSFSLNMDITSNNIAKLGAVRQGLILVWDLGFKLIHLEINSMIILSWLTTNNDISPNAILLLCDCKNLMERDWTVQVCHIFHKANGSSDALAKRGNQQHCLLEIYDTCSAFVYTPFVWDMENLETNRLCPLRLELFVVV